MYQPIARGETNQFWDTGAIAPDLDVLAMPLNGQPTHR